MNVSAKNDAPVILSGNSISFNEDTRYVMELTDLQVDDPDNYFPADFTLLIGNGQHYTHAGDTIIPENNYYGDIQVSLRVRDLLDQSDEYLLTMTVDPVNDPPSIIIPEERSAIEGNYFEIQLEADDVDLTDPLQMSSVSIPSWLTFNVSNGRLTGTPLNQNIGDNPVKIRVNDSHLSVDSTFAILVKVNTGTGDLNGDLTRFTVSPNPANDFLRVIANDQNDLPARFRLIHISGILILEQDLMSDDTMLNLPHHQLPPGLYIYEISGRSGELLKGRVMITNGIVHH
jgi:hypothetical protein